MARPHRSLLERRGAYAALLPALDPTTMGWAGRDWNLGPHRAQLFDSTGNAGPTVWWDGHIVGGWNQTESGEVIVELLEDVGTAARAAIAARADQLTRWLGGVRITPRFPSPLWRARSGADRNSGQAGVVHAADWGGRWPEILTALAVWIALPLVAGAFRTIRRDVS